MVSSLSWVELVTGLSDVLSLILVAKLITMRLHAAYRIFSIFLLSEILADTFALIAQFTSINRVLDYRVAYVTFQVISWILSLAVVYTLLQAILNNLSGILHFAQRVFKFTVPLAVLIALGTAAPEYIASGAHAASTPLAYAVQVTIILSRVVSSVCVLTLLITLFFILWFPVVMPRNLAVFSIGFAVYFSSKTFLLLFYNFWSHDSRVLISNIVATVLCACLLYWLLFLNRSGEFAQVTLGHSWGPDKQTTLLKDLEHLNTVLSRAGRT